jgi:hypothetical protein
MGSVYVNLDGEEKIVQNKSVLITAMDMEYVKIGDVYVMINGKEMIAVLENVIKLV